MPKKPSLAAEKGILTPIQKDFIRLFASLADQEQFYLAGGTALAEYYLGHRLSFDLDFFTGIKGLVLPLSYQIEQSGQKFGLDISVVRRFATFAQFMVSNQNGSQKIDLAMDSPFRFEPPVLTKEGIFVNNYQDLRIDKLLAYFGRAEPRDAVDLYFIMQNEPLESLLEQAAQKDTGFDLYWFAIALNKSAKFPDELERWPVKMLVPLQPVKLKAQFKDLAVLLMNRIKK